MKVRDIMTTEVAAASPDSSLGEVAAMMRDEDAGAIPVVEDGALTGIITDRGVSSARGRENKRQARVVPIREQARAPRHRKAS